MKKGWKTVGSILSVQIQTLLVIVLHLEFLSDPARQLRFQVWAAAGGAVCPHPANSERPNHHTIPGFESQRELGLRAKLAGFEGRRALQERRGTSKQRDNRASPGGLRRSQESSTTSLVTRYCQKRKLNKFTLNVFTGICNPRTRRYLILEIKMSVLTSWCRGDF